MKNSADLIRYAYSLGFSDAAVMRSEDLVVVPSYRMFCEENLCGCYDRLPVCPPKCGTVEEMTAAFRAYAHALILQTTVLPEDDGGKGAKLRHNELSGQLMEHLQDYGIEQYLYMSAGPWKGHSCMSAYCVDAQKMADCVGMQCWVHDGLNRFFSLILF